MTAQMLQEIFFTVLIPLIGILCTYGIAFLKKKTHEIQVQVNSELFTKYSEMLIGLVETCVIATNQTYVEALKNKNAFDVDAQREAFNLTYQAVLRILSQDATEFLSNAVGDLDTYIRKMIEAEVNTNKMLKAVPELPAITVG